MNKDAKATEYRIEPLVKILRSEAISDGGTQKKAAALEGKWIRLNETEFAFEEVGKVTRVHIDEDAVGCACGRCNNGLKCEHILAFEDLAETPQLSIESRECRWLSEYLLSLGWYAENRYLYPSLDAPEVVAELPPVDGSPKLDPVNEDKPLDIGVDEEPEPTMYERKCMHCGFVSKGYDINEVKQRIDDHRTTCTKNPANKKKPKQVTQEAPEQPKEPVVKESSTTEKPPKEEEKAYACKRCGAEFDDVDDMLHHIEECNESQDIEDTKALIASDSTRSDEDWTDAQIEVMRKTVADKATPEEFAYFLNVAKYSGLNPFLKEIYFMKTDKGQTAIITGRDGYLTIAKRDKRFRGIHSMEVCENDEFEMSFIDSMMKVSKHNITDFKDRGEIIGAWACGRMDRQDPVTIFASMKEYDKSSNAMGGKIWKQYTSSMIRKVAESMVLKRIAGISGLVTDAEIGGTELVTLDGVE